MRKAPRTYKLTILMVLLSLLVVLLSPALAFASIPYPENFHCTQLTSTSAEFKWEPCIYYSIILTYKIYATSDGVPWHLVGTTSTDSFWCTGLTPNTYYDFYVKASTGSSESISSTTVNLRTPSPLDAPTGLTAAYDSASSQVSLHWTDNSPAESGYTVFRRTGSGAYDVVQTSLPPNLTSYSDHTVTPGSSYTYKVACFRAIEESLPSNEVSVTIPAPALPAPTIPAAPTGLTASVSGSAVNLNWTDNATNEDGYQIERCPVGGSYGEIVALPANSNYYTDSSVTSGTTYSYRVFAYNSAGDSTYSNVATAAVPAVAAPVTPPSTPPATPATPMTPSTPSVATGDTVIRLYISSSTYYVNDVARTMDTAPVINEGRTLLPIRYVAEPLGAHVSWFADDQKVLVMTENKETAIQAWIGNSTARINNSNVQIDPANSAVTPIIVPPGRTLLPLRFIVENLGCRVDWNPTTQEVKITYPRP